MRKKIFFKKLDFKKIAIFIGGLCVGIISVWPGIISGKSRNCFLKILLEGSNGSIKVETLLSMNPNYLLKIKNTKNKYLKVLLIGDSCFRKF